MVQENLNRSGPAKNRIFGSLLNTANTYIHFEINMNNTISGPEGDNEATCAAANQFFLISIQKYGGQ